MAIIKVQDGTSDPIITRMVAEDKVCGLRLRLRNSVNDVQGAVVQEA